MKADEGKLKEAEEMKADEKMNALSSADSLTSVEKREIDASLQALHEFATGKADEKMKAELDSLFSSSSSSCPSLISASSCPDHLSGWTTSSSSSSSHPPAPAAAPMAGAWV